MPHTVQPENVGELLLAGNSTMTFRSVRTGERFTYKVTRRDEGSWRVGLLTGPSNETDYKYIGSVMWDRERYPAPRFFPPREVNLDRAPASTKGFAALLRLAHSNPGALGRLAEAYHAGRCARCGRTLTTPESVERGLGPECADKV